MHTVTLITKPGCHLCDDARPIVEHVVARYDDVELVERDLHSDAALTARYADDIPVVLVDGRQHSSWRVDASRLAARLEQVRA